VDSRFGSYIKVVVNARVSGYNPSHIPASKLAKLSVRGSPMRRIVTLLLLLCCLSSLTYAKGSGGHGGKSSGKTAKAPKAPKVKKAKASKADKTVHVNGYTRKDGTHVAAYDRRPAGTADTSASLVNTSSTTHPYRRNYVAEGLTPHSSVTRDRHGKIKRSKAAKAAFEREQPCPSTGKTSGRCPGYIVDHVRPLERGGADAPGNMQWQTIAAAKAKDKTEGSCRI
jgi:hypothetical protein